MKRYLIFAFDDYYPVGGVDDLIGSVDELPTLKSVREFALEDDNAMYENFNALDTETGKEVRLL